MSTQPAHAQATPSVVLSSSHSAPAARRPNPLLTVLRWELRRALASRTTWVLAVLLFGLCLLLLGFSVLQQQYPASATVLSSTGAPVQRAADGFVTRNSLFGLAILLPITVLEFADR